MGDRSNAGFKLLADDEPAAVFEERRHGSSNFVIVVDHAGARIPRSLDNLGLDDTELTRHIAWDIGALGLARRMSAILDAPLVAQNYSRLVIDCNRDPSVETSIPRLSECVAIPGNVDLGEAESAARRAEIFEPYHEHISARSSMSARPPSRRTILVAQHTMTDVYKGASRDMHAAVLYNRDRRFAGLVLEMLRREREHHVRGQRALLRQRRDRLHHPAARRGARAAARRDRDSPGPHPGRGGTGGLGGAAGAGAARGRRPRSGRGNEGRTARSE